MPDPGGHGQDQLVWACGLAPGRAPQILSSSGARTTTQRTGSIACRSRARLVVQTGPVALATRRSPACGQPNHERSPRAACSPCW